MFSFPGRKSRVSELIEQAIERTNHKLTVRDMSSWLIDVFDVQARASLPDMLYCAERATVKLSEAQKAKIAVATKLLKDWDYQFRPDSSAASVFAAWELNIAYYLHEKKITSPVMRISMNYAAPVNQFTWISIKEWADHMRESGESTHAEYCAVNEIAGDDCLNFMVYTLVKGIEDVEVRKGHYDAATNNWKYGTFATMKLEHQPFSQTPLKYWFDRTVEGKGNKRTVNLFWDMPNLKERYESNAGPVCRM